jgi:hypothetical protein
MSRTGHCLCGAVSYVIEGEPMAVAVCHCEHCQRQSGSAFSVNLMVDASQLTVTGTLSVYEETGESGGDVVYVRRCFCGGCGSSIVSELLEAGTVVAVKAGTLDDKSDIRPIAEVWCVDRQPWVELPGMAVSLEREA